MSDQKITTHSELEPDFTIGPLRISDCEQFFIISQQELYTLQLYVNNAAELDAELRSRRGWGVIDAKLHKEVQGILDGIKAQQDGDSGEDV